MGGMLTGRFPWAQLKSDIREEIQNSQTSSGSTLSASPGTREGRVMNHAVDQAMAEIEGLRDLVSKRVSEIVSQGIRMARPAISEIAKRHEAAALAQVGPRTQAKMAAMKFGTKGK